MSHIMNCLLWTILCSLAIFTTAHPSNHDNRRPVIPFSPYSPFRSLPPSPPRTRTCHVQSHNDLKTDDSPYILQAINACNNGGRVVFSANKNYLIGTALNLTYLAHIDLDIRGYILFTNDTDYWQTNAFKQIFQNATTFFQIGGQDVNIYGGGTLDGNGQVWYDLYTKNIYILRPILFGIVGLKGGTVANLNFRYSPQYYNWIANSSDVVYHNISITGFSKSNNTAKNTDGWDTYRSEYITIQNSIVNNGDDCVSFKPNSTNMLVQNMNCNGSHGISVGSLGQYPTETDYVENILVYNVNISNATDGARIKVWPNSFSSQSGDLQGGGGMGAVRNITYDTMKVTNVDYAIEITQCYGQKNFTQCIQAPSRLTISDIKFNNIYGTTSKVYQPLVGHLVCSDPSVCSNITATDIHITSPNSTTLFTCLNVNQSLLGVNCTTQNLGYN